MRDFLESMSRCECLCVLLVRSLCQKRICASRIKGSKRLPARPQNENTGASWYGRKLLVTGRQSVWGSRGLCRQFRFFVVFNCVNKLFRGVGRSKFLSGLHFIAKDIYIISIEHARSVLAHYQYSHLILHHLIGAILSVNR
jgi:hypothetical protein